MRGAREAGRDAARCLRGTLRLVRVAALDPEDLEAVRPIVESAFPFDRVGLVLEEKLLGAERYAEFRKNYQADRAAAITGAEALAKGVPADLAVKVEAEIQAGKPADAVDAAAMLRRVSGRTHQVVTAVSVLSVSVTSTPLPTAL